MGPDFTVYKATGPMRAVGLALLVSLLAVALLLAACNPSSEVKLDAEDNGSRIELTQGQELTVSLISNPSTGFGWEVAEPDDGVLQQDGEVQFEPQSDIVGAPGMQTVRFKAIATGEATLKLLYRRPWETDAEAIETFSVIVLVR